LVSIKELYCDARPTKSQDLLYRHSRISSLWSQNLPFAILPQVSEESFDEPSTCEIWYGEDKYSRLLWFKTVWPGAGSHKQHPSR